MFIIASETLGSRGLCCFFRTEKRNVLVDPGTALGYIRKGLLPHPVQVGAGIAVKEKILQSFFSATDVVISHYHGDHVPLSEPNPFQLALEPFMGAEKGRKIWVRSFASEKGRMKRRAEDIWKTFEGSITVADRCSSGILSFGGPFSHGPEETGAGEVLVTMIQTDKGNICHGSDIQLLSGRAVVFLADLKPAFLILSGPPIYRGIREDLKRKAFENALLLSERTGILVIDHHLFRSLEGYEWMDSVKERSDRNILTSAEFMQMPEHPLEAKREQLYRDIHVPQGWHEKFALKKANCDAFLEEARKIYSNFCY